MTHDYFSLINKREIATNTYEFTFRNHNLSYSFRPGQYAYITLHGPNIADPTRIFSFVHAPRNNGEVVIAARIRSESDYKRALASLSIGENVQISRAIGFFDVPHDAALPLVFIAGGIGVVPFVSMLEYLVDTNQDRSLILFVSNTSRQTSVYLDEIQSLLQKIPSAKLITTFTQIREDGAESGRVTPAMLKKYDAIAPCAHYFLAGTPAMVEQLSTDLQSLDIPAKTIHMEAFTGY